MLSTSNPLVASLSSAMQESEALIAAGNVNIAINLLQHSIPQAKSPQERCLLAIALADALLRSGQIKAAESELNKIDAQIKPALPVTLLAELTLRYGHLYAALSDNDKASKWYRQALEHAKEAEDPILIAVAAINLSKQTGASDLLTAARVSIQQIPISEARHGLLLSLGYQASQQGEFELAYSALQDVLNATQTQRIKSQALGYLGRLYEQQGRQQEALKLTEQAILADNSADLQLQWLWQRARLLILNNDITAALSSYRSALQLLQIVRTDIPIVYQGGQSSFKQTFLPLYQGYIDLLLQQARQESETSAQPILQEVLQTWELLKAEELQDYFRDACSVKQKSKLNQIDASTAVVYPILLEQRAEVIVRFKDQIKAYPVKHSKVEIERNVRRLKDQMRNKITINANKVLYQWLIAPIQADLQAANIDTLIYLPDGLLRKVPLALLSDGEQYLIEQYALVTVPGLSMLAAPTKKQDRSDIILAGVSEPGPVIEELLARGINLFEPPKKEDQPNTSRLLNLRALYIQSDDNRTVEEPERNLRATRMKKVLALPGVIQELKSLSELTKEPVMQNSGFVSDHFKQAVNQGHAAVHIASHGYFSGDPKKSFIMAYDHLLNMEQLAELFQTEAFLDRPVELITLSACQTAEGDDRSPLGLSGVIVQTGVKSAIGTLWPVADEAAKQFFTDFYHQYQIPGMTKAKAMQYAQKQLMKSNESNDPSYWAPFVLIGEWH